MSVMVYEVIFILLLTFLNGLFGMSEVALLSARKVRLQMAAAQGNRRARAALDLLADPNNFLSAVQVGVTLVGVLSGAFGGATIAEAIAAYLQSYPVLAPHGEAIGLGVVVVSITYLSLILGELVPKRVALGNPERIAAGVARPMTVLARFARPLIRFLSFSTNSILRLFRVRPSQEPPVTEEEVRALLDQGTETGMFDRAERQILERVFRFADRKVDVLMTLRKDIVWLDVQDLREKMLMKIRGSNHSTFPVCDGQLDRALGVLHVKDLVSAGSDVPTKNLLREPLFVPEGMSALKVLEQFKERRTHLALVVDEYGSIQGMFTLKDVLEAIVGELPSTNETSDPPVVRRNDGSWLVDGTLPIDEMREILKVNEPLLHDRGSYRTLAGFMIEHIKRIPTVGDHFTWHGIRFEVVDMDGHRIDKVLVVPGKAQ